MTPGAAEQRDGDGTDDPGGKTTLGRVAAFGLPGLDGPITTHPLPEATWGPLLGDVRRLRLSGFLQAAVREGALPVTDGQWDDVGELHLQASMNALLLERRLLDVGAVLDRSGIDFVVLKGAAVAHLDYPETALRSFGDNDILLRSAQFDDAVEVLEGHGYRRQTAQARPGFERRFAKGTTMDGPGGDEVDLHRNLVFGTFGFLIDLDELFASSVAFQLGGRTLRGLGPETRLIHACYHAALGDPIPKPGSVRDIAQMLAAGDRDSERVLALARAWRSEAVIARGMNLCQQVLGSRPEGLIPDTVGRHVLSRRERRAIASYVGENRRFAHKAVASLPYIPGWRDKASFLRAVIAPEEGFAESFGGRSGVTWVSRGIRSLLRGSGR